MDVSKLLFIDLLSAVFGCHVQLPNLMQQCRCLDEQRRRLLLLLATVLPYIATYCCGICITSILHHLVADFMVVCVRSYFLLFLLHQSYGHRILFNKTSVAK